jgi:hypothetical protein
MNDCERARQHDHAPTNMYARGREKHEKAMEAAKCTPSLLFFLSLFTWCHIPAADTHEHDPKSVSRCGTTAHERVSKHKPPRMSAGVVRCAASVSSFFLFFSGFFYLLILLSFFFFLLITVFQIRTS